jgi:hypothetical protein
MDANEGARRALIQSTRQGVALMRDNAEANRKLARAYGTTLSADVAAIPDDLLREYESAVRDEAASATKLADALAAALASQ